MLLIIADDVGWFDVGAYHRGIMGGATPHIDRIGAEGAMLTDCYAQASCTAGRAAFITGQIPMRTGLTTVMSLPDTRAELAAMTDEQILAHYRQADSYIGMRMAKELHRCALKFWHLGAIKREADREAKDKALQELRANLFPID